MVGAMTGIIIPRGRREETWRKMSRQVEGRKTTGGEGMAMGDRLVPVPVTFLVLFS